MAKVNKNENEVAVVEALSKTELFFEKYGRQIVLSLVAAVVLAAGIFCWYKFIYQSAAEEALGQMAIAEQNFRASDYEVALNGNGNDLGFAQIIDEYGAKAGKAAYFYAGVCELQLGNWESAVNYLKAYKGKDAILAARAAACMGDAYIGLEEYSKALACFEKAAAEVDNMFAAGYLLKAGLTAEKLGEESKALACYKKIKDQYPQSIEGFDIDKYIARIENK